MKGLKSQIIVLCGSIAENVVQTHLNSNNNKSIDVFSMFGFDKAADQIDVALVKYLKKDYGTQIFGHALGAALGVLFTLHLQSEGFKEEKLITFGQPKIVREKESQQYKSLPLVRIVDYRDPVPLLFPGYIHTGPEVVLFPDRYYSNMKEHVEDSSVQTRFDENHIESYLRNLKGKQKISLAISYDERNNIAKASQ